MKKSKFIFLSLSFFLFICSCDHREDILSDCKSSYSVDDTQKKLKLGMTYYDVVKLVNSTPIMIGNGSIHFILKNGDLWIRCTKDYDNIERVFFWKTQTNLSDGNTITKTSQDDSINKPLTNPVCINLFISGEFKGEKASSKFYYENYGMGNMLCEFHIENNGIKKGSIFIVDGTYLLTNGDIPESAELNIFHEFMIQSSLLQYFLIKSIPEGPIAVKVKNNINLGSQKNELKLPLQSGENFIYPAPWSAKGWVKPARKNNGINFNINFGNWENVSSDKIHKINFQGQLYIKKKTLPNSMSLDKWKRCLLARGKDVTLINKRFKILGDLRKYNQ